MDGIDIFVNHRQLLEKDLDAFIDYYDGDQPELITALTSKIKHMCINIGSPSSVKPMLESIANGKIKRWSTNWRSNGQKLPPFMTRFEASRIHDEWDWKLKGDKKDWDNGYWEKKYSNIVTGHFRWNNGTGYIANYQTRDYIRAFWLDGSIDKTGPKPEPKPDGLRFRYVRAHAAYHGGTTYTVEILTTGGNEYRFHYYADNDKVSCNWGDFNVNDFERNWVINKVKEKYKRHFEKDAK